MNPMAQQPADGKVMHFTCDHCKILLTVDVGLAGVSGPCPSCGESVTAPLPRVPKPIARARRDQSVEESSGTGSPLEIRDRGRVEMRPVISPGSGISEVSRERAEVATVAKILVAGVVVLIIGLGVTYLLNQ